MSCQAESSSVDAAIEGRFHGIHFCKLDDDICSRASAKCVFEIVAHERFESLHDTIVPSTYVLIPFKYGYRTVIKYSLVVKPFSNVAKRLPNRYVKYPVVT
jgi:hypothetical protein